MSCSISSSIRGIAAYSLPRLWSSPLLSGLDRLQRPCPELVLLHLCSQHTFSYSTRMANYENVTHSHFTPPRHQPVNHQHTPPATGSWHQYSTPITLGANHQVSVLGSITHIYRPARGRLLLTKRWTLIRQHHRMMDIVMCRRHPRMASDLSLSHLWPVSVWA